MLLLGREPLRIKPNPSELGATLMSAQLFNTKSAPARRNSASSTVVRNAMTLAPASLPARIPAGTSSTTTHAEAAKPNFAGAFRNGSGCGLPSVTSVEVTIRSGTGKPAARSLTSASGRVHEVAIVHRFAGSCSSNSGAPGKGYDSVRVLLLTTLYLAVFCRLIGIR